VTDAERARALAEALLGPVGLTPDVLAALEEALTVTRLEERRAVAAWLHRGLIGLIHRLGDRIERGEHARASQPAPGDGA
jgi:hypothetical protein